jgi:hypothetical protein
MTTETKEAFDITLANCLPNGAMILERRQSKGASGGFVVLCCWEQSVAKYVTWRVDSLGNAFWGHYHTDITSAAKDYAERL